MLPPYPAPKGERNAVLDGGKVDMKKVYPEVKKMEVSMNLRGFMMETPNRKYGG